MRTDKTKEGIISKWEQVKRRWAGILGKKVNRLSKRSLKLLLAAYLLIGTGLIAFELWLSVFSGPKIVAPVEAIGTVRLPPVDKPVEDPLKNRLKAYRKKLEALPDAQRQKLMQERPGLIDSLVTAEELYNISK